MAQRKFQVEKDNTSDALTGIFSVLSKKTSLAIMISGMGVAYFKSDPVAQANLEAFVSGPVSFVQANGLSYLGPAAMMLGAYALVRHGSGIFKSGIGTHVSRARTSNAAQEYDASLPFLDRRWWTQNKLPVQDNSLPSDLSLYGSSLTLHHINMWAKARVALSQLTSFGDNKPNIKYTEEVKNNPNNPDEHTSPYHAYTKDDVNMVHLAAMLGVDNSPFAQGIKSFSCMRSPELRAIFHEAGDILRGLKDNTKNVRHFAQDMFESLGDASKHLFDKPSSFLDSMKQWEDMTYKAYAHTIHQKSQMSIRQFGVESIDGLSQALISPSGLNQKQVVKYLKIFDRLSSFAQYDSPTLPFKEIGSVANDLSAALRVVQAGGQPAAHALHLPAKTQNLISSSSKNSQSDAPSRFNAIHSSLYGDKHAYPSAQQVTDIFIHKILDDVRAKVRDSKDIKASNSPLQDSNKIMNGIAERTAVRMAQKNR